MTEDVNQKRKVIVITTGGTIDKSYDESVGHLYNKESLVAKDLGERLRLPYTELEVHSIMAKDSLEMTEEDRKLICDKVIEFSLSQYPVVVIHGTDTMQQSAEFIEQAWKEIAVPVIFTGAMRPLGVDKTDALQNVVEALLATQFVSGGVYISFHGKVFSVPGVRKNHQLRTFEEYK